MKGQELNFATIKQAVSMEAVLRHYQMKDLKGRGGQLRGRCPIHQGEGREAFHVEIKRKIFHCFSCGAGGDVLDLVSLLDKCTLPEAACRLKDWFPGVATCGDPPCKTTGYEKKYLCQPAAAVSASRCGWRAPVLSDSPDRGAHGGPVRCGLLWGSGDYERTSGDTDSRRRWAVSSLCGSVSG